MADIAMDEKGAITFSLSKVKAPRKDAVPENIELPSPGTLTSIPTKERGSDGLTLANLDSQVEYLYVRGYTMNAIAEHLDVSLYKVNTSVSRVRDQWRKSTVFDFNAAIVEQLRKLDELEVAAWKEFEISRVDIEEETEDTDSTVTGVTGRKRKSSKHHAASSRFLDIIEKCIEQRCRILGLYAPKEVAVTQRKVNSTPIEELTQAELMQLAARQKKLVKNGIEEAEYDE